MSEAIPLTRPRTFPSLAKLAGLVPGIALLAVVGLLGKAAEQGINGYCKAHRIVFPNIEYVLWAILIGLVIANVTRIPKLFEAGIATYEFWLKAGVVLLGSRFLLGDVLKLGGISLVLVVVEIAGSLALMVWLGRLFGLKPKLVSLLAVGTSVCGVSAIIAAQGSIDAEDDDAALAIAAILALGAFALFAFPLIGHFLHMSDRAFGVWAGLAVDNTAETIAAGAIYSDTAGKIAILVKTARNAMIGFVVLGFAIHWSRKGLAGQVGNRTAFLLKTFPKFVLGFLVVSLLLSFHAFNKAQVTALANLSRWAFLLTFAGVGLRMNFRQLFRQGLRPFVVGALGEVLIAFLTLGLVVGANALWRI
ncbi:MAG: putative sulfate exporter family transporter [Holophaga sp.]|nr:putative sulfate exporter family transporter [Holophaga sp.]